MCGILVLSGIEQPFHHRLLRGLRRRGPDGIGFWSDRAVDIGHARLAIIGLDEFGVKPLYYWRSKGRLCVSSLIGTILGAVGEAPELDYDAMSEYVRYQFTFGDKTFVKQIRKVPPGHIVEIDVDSGQTRTSCYEDIFAPAGGPRE